MSKRTSASAVRAYVRKLQNPYAAVQVEEPWREEYRRSENPHALHYYVAEAETPPIARPLAVAAPVPALGKLSKETFRARCRAIFRPYIPALEKGKLRSHHREFILRNEERSAETRFALIAHLNKYDLSAVPGLSSQFNRERDSMTEEKLAAIERAAGIVD